jgi:hypothetical protein
MPVIWRVLVSAFTLQGAEAREPRRPEVGWQAPAACPSSDEVVARIDELDDEVAAAEISAEAEVVAKDGLFVLDATLTTPRGVTHRQVEDPDCSVLADAFAVFVVGAAAPVDEPPPVVVPEPTPPVRPPPEPASRSRWIPLPGGVVQLGGLAEIGLTPRFGGGVLLRGGVAWPRFRVLLGMNYTAPRFHPLAGAGVGVDIQVVDAQLGVCPGYAWTRIEAWVCGELHLGAVVATGRGVQRPRSVASPWVAAGAAPGLSVGLREPVRFFVEIEAGASLTRPRFELGGLASTFDTGIPFGRLVTGLAFRWGARPTQ